MSEPKFTHSPTPWTHATDEGENHIRDQVGNSLFCDCHYYPWVSAKDFDFIVQAVNSHEDLYRALYDIRMSNAGTKQRARGWDNAITALAKARGEKHE